MKYRIEFLIFLFILFTLFNVTISFAKISFAEELIGPEIYGLQLGMPTEDAEKIKDNICSQKTGKKDCSLIHINNCMNLEFMFYVHKGDNPHILSLYTLSPQLFDSKLHSFNDDFIGMFCKHYNLPIDRFEQLPAPFPPNYGLVYNNYDQGYSILISSGTIILQIIAKSSGYQFK